MFSACRTNIIGSSSVEDSQLKLVLNLEKQEVGHLSQLEAQFSVKNISGGPISYRFSSGCQHGFTIEKGNELVFDSRMAYGCTQALTELNLEPGESKTYSILLESISDDEFKTNDAGIYQLNAFLLEGYSPEVSTSFTLKNGVN
ncbi:MAG: BsuPI-related putative proteinase inhibitor [Balneolaceae bacterium]|nr:BsuPI-related putative proteinase inhibitor [Balneolaceae bacterium]